MSQVSELGNGDACDVLMKHLSAQHGHGHGRSREPLRTHGDGHLLITFTCFKRPAFKANTTEHGSH